MRTDCSTSIRWSGCFTDHKGRGPSTLPAAAVVLCLIAWVTLAAAQAGPIEYRLDTGSMVGKPVSLEVKLTNEGTGVLAVDLGLSNRTYFTFDLMSPDGHRSSIRPKPGDGFQPGGRFRLAAGESQTVTVPLNDLLDLNRPGSYVLMLKYDGTVTRQGEAVQVQRQTRWEFTLGKKDPEQLRRRCGELLQIIVSPARQPEHQSAVMALTAIRDVVAVPYLLRSAEARGLATEEVGALEKIGGPEAKEALQRLTKSSNRFTAAAANGALARVK